MCHLSSWTEDFWVSKCEVCKAVKYFSSSMIILFYKCIFRTSSGNCTIKCIRTSAYLLHTVLGRARHGCKRKKMHNCRDLNDVKVDGCFSFQVKVENPKQSQCCRMLGIQAFQTSSLPSWLGMELCCHRHVKGNNIFS